MGIRLDELASIRSTVNQFLPWRGTVARTSVTAPMSLAMDNTRTQHLEHTPSFNRLPLWKLTLTDGVDLKASDVVVVEQQISGTWVPVGTYIIMFSTSRGTYSVSTIGYGLQATDGDGDSSAFTNATVVFRSAERVGDETPSVKVLIYETSPMMKSGSLSAPHDAWTILYDSSSIVFPSGHPIGPNDEIAWARFGTDQAGRVRSMPISRPRPYPGLIPLATAFFDEMA